MAATKTMPKTESPINAISVISMRLLTGGKILKSHAIHKRPME